jgi:hypothetical protein
MVGMKDTLEETTGLPARLVSESNIQPLGLLSVKMFLISLAHPESE